MLIAKKRISFIALSSFGWSLCCDQHPLKFLIFSMIFLSFFSIVPSINREILKYSLTSHTTYIYDLRLPFDIVNFLSFSDNSILENDFLSRQPAQTKKKLSTENFYYFFFLFILLFHFVIFILNYDERHSVCGMFKYFTHGKIYIYLYAHHKWPSSTTQLLIVKLILKLTNCKFYFIELDDVFM